MATPLDHIQAPLDRPQQCRRLFHGRGRAYPGLEHVNIDWLPPVALITLFDEVEHEWLLELAQELDRTLPDCRSVQVRYRCRAKTPYETLIGDDIDELIGRHEDLKFHLQLGRSQNIGLFLDMANGWHWVRKNAEGKRVLNLFAYTCPFSVAALAGGAEHVVNVDISKAALSRGRENHRLNNQDTSRVTFHGVNIFKSFSKIKKSGPYDLMICDPPAFQKGSVDIKRDYAKIIRRIPELMNPGAQLMLCLNSPELGEDFMFGLIKEHCPACRQIGKIEAPPEFVETEPERGLKVWLFEYCD